MLHRRLLGPNSGTHPIMSSLLFVICLLICSGQQPAMGVEGAGDANGGESWAFQPARDDFSSEALLDLRGLNEKVAGDHGFIGRSKDGNDFVFGDGTSARFWAVNDGAFDRDLDRHARFLAKRGINMVRFHCNITPTNDDLMDIDKTDRDHLWRGVAAMKKQGI